MLNNTCKQLANAFSNLMAGSVRLDPCVSPRKIEYDYIFLRIFVSNTKWQIIPLTFTVRG